MKVSVLDLKAQYSLLKEELDQAIAKVLDSGQFVMGPEVEELETRIARFCGTKFAVAVASGTDALYLALRAIGVGQGDEVITTPFTFGATAEAISHTGATPVFVDIDPRTFNLDASKVESAVTSKTRALLPVHLYGQVAEMDPLCEIARKHRLAIVEDAAQAIGATYDPGSKAGNDGQSLSRGKRAGNLGDLGCFSFYPTKNLGAYGDAGIVTTNDETLKERLKALRAHGSKKKYYYDYVGVNSRLDTLQAAILLVKLKHLESWNQTRRKWAALYGELLKGSEVNIPYEAPYAGHVYHQYTIRIQQRDELAELLKSRSIGSMIFYPLCLHLQQVYRPLGLGKGDFPEAEKAQREVLSLPMYPELTEEAVRYVAESVKEFALSGVTRK